MTSETLDPRLANITVAHAPAEQQNEIRDGDDVIGFTRYRNRARGHAAGVRPNRGRSRLHRSRPCRPAR